MGRGEFFLNKEKVFSEVIAKEIFKASIYLKVAKVGGRRDKGGTIPIYIYIYIYIYVCVYIYIYTHKYIYIYI